MPSQCPLILFEIMGIEIMETKLIYKLLSMVICNYFLSENFLLVWEITVVIMTLRAMLVDADDFLVE